MGLLEDYVKLRDETDWGGISDEEFRRRILLLREMYECLVKQYRESLKANPKASEPSNRGLRGDSLSTEGISDNPDSL